MRNLEPNHRTMWHNCFAQGAKQMIKIPFSASPVGNIALWRMCLCLAEQKSLSRTAETIGTDVSYISKNLNRLEAELGVKIFERTTHAIALTSEGRIMLQQAETLVEEHDRLLGLFGKTAGRTDQIVITSPALMLETLVSTWIAKFLEKFPEVSVDLRISETTLRPQMEGVDISFLTGKAVTTNETSFLLGSQPAYLSASLDTWKSMAIPKNLPISMPIG